MRILTIGHRDFKSADVMVAETGQAKSMDFGLARVAETKHQRILKIFREVMPLFPS